MKKQAGSNYVADNDTRPTMVFFENGRTVRIVDGYLEVGWLRDVDDESISGPILWTMRMALLGMRNPEILADVRRLKRENEELRKQVKP